jgi:hypothetical protein
MYIIEDSVEISPPSPPVCNVCVTQIWQTFQVILIRRVSYFSRLDAIAKGIQAYAEMIFYRVDQTIAAKGKISVTRTANNRFPIARRRRRLGVRVAEGGGSGWGKRQGEGGRGEAVGKVAGKSDSEPRIK